MLDSNQMFRKSSGDAPDFLFLKKTVSLSFFFTLYFLYFSITYKIQENELHFTRKILKIYAFKQGFLIFFLEMKCLTIFYHVNCGLFSFLNSFKKIERLFRKLNSIKLTKG